MGEEVAMEDDDKRQLPNFLFVPGDDGTERLVNLDAIKLIDQMAQDHVRLWFSETFKMELNGPFVTDLLLYIVSRNCIAHAGLQELPKFMRPADTK